MAMKLALSLLLLVFFSASCFSLDVYKGLQVRSVTRTIDLSSQFAKHNILLAVANTGTQSTSEFYLAIEDFKASNLAFISVKAEAGAKLVVGAPSEVQTANNVKFRYYRVDLGRSLAPQDSLNLIVSLIFTHSMQPVPAQISQNDRQLVKYEDNHYFFSPYEVLSQRTTVKLASTAVEAHSELSPSTLKGDTITYGPYQDRPAFSYSPSSVHFENNQPFITVTSLTKVFEVSHWGNLNVEEWYEMRHDGAKLRGQFSRFEYRRTGKNPSVKSLTHVLPLEAHSIYYRDEIGNISTSAIGHNDRALLLELVPRFPLFGGWQTKFYMGYDLPLSLYLFNDQNDASLFMLNVSFAKDFTNDIVIDDLTVKIILPEGVKDIKTHLPFPVESESRDLHFTYLDTYGRPVVVLHKKNIIGEHNQFFQITYRFSRVSMLQEPILLIGAYFLFFVFAMIYVRFRLSIKPDDKSTEDGNEGKVSELLQKVKDIHTQRAELQSTLKDATEKLGKSKNSSQYATEKKNIELQLSKLQTEALVVVNELEELDEDKAAQVRQVERQEQAKQAYFEELIRLEGQYREKRMPKAVYEDSKQQFEKNYEKADEDIDKLISDLLEDL